MCCLNWRQFGPQQRECPLLHRRGFREDGEQPSSRARTGALIIVRRYS